MAQRSSVITLLMVLAFFLAGYLVYTGLIKRPAQHTIEVVVCTTPDCRHVFEVEASGEAPYECPKCGQKSAYLAFQCVDPECGAIFPVRPAMMATGENIVCPICGGQGRQLWSVPRDADAQAAKGAAE